MLGREVLLLAWIYVCERKEAAQYLAQAGITIDMVNARTRGGGDAAAGVRRRQQGDRLQLLPLPALGNT